MNAFFKKCDEQRAMIQKSTGWITHDLIHPKYGWVDSIWITGKETKEQLLKLERAGFARLNVARTH